MHQIEKHIESNWNHLKNKSITVACSGGLDSIVLVSILHNLGLDIDVIHVNYQLRGNDSELDASFVKDFCQEHDINCKVRKVDLNEQLKDGGNLQEKARNVRYEWFQEILDSSEDNRVALAHHADDQVESFFLNLARKSGVMGLACMPAENDGIVRPLLNFSKDDLIDYAKQEGVEWREDKSNQDSKYKRNLLRNEILPELKKSFPDLEESVLTLIQNFQSKQGDLENEVRPMYDEIIKTKALPITSFNTLSDFSLIELFRLLEQPSGIALETRKLKSKGTKIDLVRGQNHDFTSVTFDESQLSFTSNSKEALPKLIVESVNDLPTTFSKSIIYLDAKKIKGTLKVRRWETGDRIAPIGMNGSRLISDVVSDAKLNALAKQNIYIVHDDAHIHWCVGLSVGRKAIAQPNSQILSIRLES